MDKSGEHTVEITPSHDNTKRAEWWKPVLLLTVVIALIVMAKIFGLDKWITNIRSFIEELGSWGPMVYALIYVCTTVAAIPGSPMTILAGAIFGTLTGIIVVSLASTTGAAFCFLIARYFARDAMVNWLAQNKKFQKLDKLTEEFGAEIVAITRLIPIFPYNLLNYGFGLTKVHFGTYVFWTWLGMLPGTYLFISASDAITIFMTEGKVSWPLILSFTIIFIIMVMLVKKARQRFKKRQEQLETH